MKSTILIFVFLTTSWFSYSQSLQDMTFGEAATFEVMTWNIEWFPKNGTTTIDSVRKVIEALDVDIIALQEISDTFAFKQLVDSLDGYEALFATNYYTGLAYLYKTDSVEIVDYYEIFHTSQHWNNFPRAPKVLEVRFRNQDFIIINNHFKCCGDGYLNYGSSSDQENRRYEATNLLKGYIDNNFPTKNVIWTGDLNDVLNDPYPNNVFQNVLDDTSNFVAADMDIATSLIFNWSYPSWPSHLDHIILTNELFDEFEASGSSIETIRIDDFMAGGFNEYDSKISDHRPVAIKFNLDATVSSIKKPVAEQPLNIYPNPASSYFTMDIAPNIQNGFVEIYNTNGEKVRSRMVLNGQDKLTWNVSDLATGLYFVQLYADGRMIKVGKLMVR